MRPRTLTRRELLQTGCTAAALYSSARAAVPRTSAADEAESPRPTGLGLVAYCVRIQREALRKQDPNSDLYHPLRLLQHCREIGAGGMQCSLAGMSAEELRGLRAQVEQHELYVEAIVRPPQNRGDVERFDREIRDAREAGALAARTTIIPGRRYEYFNSLEMFREYAARGRQALERAAPIVEKHRVPLAVENHKDQRNAERVALFEAISSEYVGACVDTGNSFALLEDPQETVEVLAPWAHSVHLKDQALQPTQDGFLLGDIPLGQGAFDLKQMVDTLRKRRPHVRFTLELITRDPLRVPCLADAYWATFPKLPARDLARTLRFVGRHTADDLQYPSRLDDGGRLALETRNVRDSLDYARDTLKL